MTDKQNFEKDINVPSKRLDRIDKMEIDLANYEKMERDIEKIIEPYQLDWELDCLSLPSAIQSILERLKEEAIKRSKELIRIRKERQEGQKMNRNLHKQLDQLKAENKTLKQYKASKQASYENIQRRWCATELQYRELKAENEELKTKLINWLGKVSLRQAEKEFCEQQLDQLKAQLLDQEAETLKAGGIIHKLEKTLAEIKPILELYANSKVGEKQPDGTYNLSGGIWDSFGICTFTYDPKPAREALQKISECAEEDGN